MNDVIGTILEAEAKAEEILRSGEQEARQILAEGEAAAERKAAETEALILSERQKRLAAADRAAEARYHAICAKGDARAEALRTACNDKIQPAAEAVMRKVLDE